MAEKYRFFATTARGIEDVLVSELREILPDAVVAPGRSGASFEGSLEAAYRVCLWSRVANRVLLPLKTFAAADSDRLYGGVRSIHWTDHIESTGTLAVDFTSTQTPGLSHTHFGALRTKDAICDQFVGVKGERPSVDVHAPDLRINVHVESGQASVSIDLSGDSLHRRGYREQGARAPLKETLAAAILRLAEWPAVAAQGGVFMDGMCGSGTLPIEAALMALKRAPGLARQRFGFERWPGHVPAAWKRVVQEARDAEIRDAKRIPAIVGYDSDFRAVRVAIANVERAGVRAQVHIEKRDFSAFEPIKSLGKDPEGIVVLNPPYGERIGEGEDLAPLYGAIGDTFKKKFAGWRGFVFTGSPELSREIGLKPSRKHVLFNGPIECRLFRYELYAGTRREPKG